MMGIFSRSHSPPRHQSTSEEKIYVLVRASGISSAARITWSLAVSQTSHGSTVTAEDRSSKQSLKPKKSFLSFSSRQNSRDNVAAHDQSPTLGSAPTHSLYEFAPSTGNLQVFQHHPSTSSSATTVNTTSEAILLQILLPQPSPHSHRSTQPLNFQIEQILHRTTSANPQLSPSETDTWLRFALITLQHEKHISPATSGFNVEKFMDFARNALTGFEGEILQGHAQSGDGATVKEFDLGAKHVKIVDYAAHVAENERLRAMFGHGTAIEEPIVTERGWGWKRQQERRERNVFDEDRDRDPYGGLM